MVGIVDHIKQQLALLPTSRVKVGYNFSYVNCPFHSEKTPSCIVRHNNSSPKTGFFKCYGCSKKGHWNTIAEALGLAPYQDGDFTPQGTTGEFNGAVYDRFLLSEEEDSRKEDLKARLEFYSLKDKDIREQAGLTKMWRNFPLRFLYEDIKAKIVKDTANNKFYLYLPVLVNSREEGFIRARIRKEKDLPSYLNAPGVWSLKKGLFLYDQSVKLMQELDISTMCVVEGPRDALRLLYAGIPAVAILGTHSWSNQKSNLLSAGGVERIISIFDGDAAGKQAYLKIVKGVVPDGYKLEFTPLEETFQVHSVKLWNVEPIEGYEEDYPYDPGNMPESILEDIKSLALERTENA